MFRRIDAGAAGAEIQASWVNTIASPLCTVLSNGEGIEIGTVEHLMAALAGAEIDNAVVELDGAEVPIMDGSAAPFLFLIECAGIVEQDAPRRAIKVLKPVSVIEEGASAALAAGSRLLDELRDRLRQSADPPPGLPGGVRSGTFKAEISRARTFGLLDEVDRAAGRGLRRAAARSTMPSSSAAIRC